MHVADPGDLEYDPLVKRGQDRRKKMGQGKSKKKHGKRVKKRTSIKGHM